MYPDSSSMIRYGKYTLIGLDTVISKVWNCAPMSTSGEIVRLSAEINSDSPLDEKHPVKLVATMRSARHAARTLVIDVDCWELYIS
jgi:hypothetical protein